MLLNFQAGDYLVHVVSPIFGAYIFIWKCHNVHFRKKLVELQNLTFCSQYKVKYIVLSVIYLTISILAIFYKHILFHLLTNSNFIRMMEEAVRSLPGGSTVNVVIGATFWIAEFWLQIFLVATYALLSIIFFSLSKEFKVLCDEFDCLIESKDIYKSKTFSTWTKKYAEMANLVEKINEHVKLFILHMITVQTFSIMRLLYNINLTNTPAIHLLRLLPRNLLHLLVAICPGVMVNYQVNVKYFP